MSDGYYDISLSCGHVVEDDEAPESGDEWRCSSCGERAVPVSWESRPGDSGSDES